MLEHSFNSILEAGEIPPVPFFTEMACQAIIQCDYEKAVNIFNTMAYAPFQVSFKDWIDFFERNRDRLDQATLIQLWEELTTHELRRDLTVLNLSRALEFMCGDKVNSVAPTNARVEKVSEDSLDYQSSGSRIETDDVSSTLDEKDRVRAHPARLAENFDRDLVSRSWSDDTDSEDGEWDSDNDDFNSEESDTPSAYEILEIWNKK